MQIPAKTLDSQRSAADPGNSAWVSANAGSGKTFVLARRVVRLLLKGTDPAKILCLTFTKAAASEMATRVYDLLAGWTEMPEADLANELESIEGQHPSAEHIAAARRLFAKALETPGGLKIQTIHAFCEALLHQFPLEANVAGHFSVLDDRLAGELLAAARARVLFSAEMEPESQQGQALAVLIDNLSDKAFAECLGEFITKRDSFRNWIVAAGSLENALDELYPLFGAPQGATKQSLAEQIQRQCLFSAEDMRAAASALMEGGKSDCDRAARLNSAADEIGKPGWSAIWLEIFLTSTRQPRKSLATKKIQSGYPQIHEKLCQEQARLVELLQKENAVQSVVVTGALVRLAEAVIGFYEAEKTRRGYLDFEDLVVRTANLLSRSDAAQWVQYKLDRGLDHILVDEAQDTSPRQWQIIRALAEEFFAGEGARRTEPTIFAVGDEKQSIYSFQGAKPAYFADMRRFFARSAERAAKPFAGVELNLSFRSTPDVLAAVDKVFAEPDAYQGLSQENVAPVHEAIRAKHVGQVEIWPLAAEQELTEPEDWAVPIDKVASNSAMVQLATRIAEQIRDWNAQGIASPGDVLVLVRKRGAFVEALNRELKRLDIPAAGADRFVLTDHIAVKDLIALARFILLPEDDLALACVLKSPLFGLDDADLFEIARETPEQTRPGTLWQMLLRKSEDQPKWQVLRKQLETWRDRADYVPPFEFYAKILGADGQRQRFRARLGSEVDDVLDEFLSLTMSYEQTGTPGLEGFVAWLQESPTEVKRELNAATGLLRIMTVHGSKGLEARFVILVDNCAAPFTAQHVPALLELPREQLRTINSAAETPPALVWAPAQKEQTPAHITAIEAYKAEQEQEYRRLLYVALTRAEDHLLVCGWAGKRGPSHGCWYELVHAALASDAKEIIDAAGDIAAWQWTLGGRTADLEAHEVPAAQSISPEVSSHPALPQWINSSLSAPKKPSRLRPSSLLDDLELKQEPTAPTALDAFEVARSPQNWALLKGQLVHRLLELLPDLPESEHAAAADRFLSSALPPEYASEKETLLSAVFGTLAMPQVKGLFSKAGKAEVPIQGVITGKDGKQKEVFGIIDRLIMQDGEAIILDYKTNVIVPKTAADVPDEYAAQLAVYHRLLSELYPHWTIRAMLLYTSEPRLLEIPPERMSAFAF
ncbi:double-strand break repair helicase AddA [Polycladidibacter hongkongensis]|uniref:double-strand break repair helicase AddA n=1 Tax=Polycladidibacter hongkongensis TaxID=1647556 RepID=UPI00082CE211|nr:double-strand break repair helicase AddA [Pseudovibrio hongkongensis]